jgi:hypothetical protein
MNLDSSKTYTLNHNALGYNKGKLWFSLIFVDHGSTMFEFGPPPSAIGVADLVSKSLEFYLSDNFPGINNPYINKLIFIDDNVYIIGQMEEHFERNSKDEILSSKDLVVLVLDKELQDFKNIPVKTRLIYSTR